MILTVARRSGAALAALLTLAASAPAAATAPPRTVPDPPYPASILRDGQRLYPHPRQDIVVALVVNPVHPQRIELFREVDHPGKNEDPRCSPVAPTPYVARLGRTGIVVDIAAYFPPEPAGGDGSGAYTCFGWIDGFAGRRLELPHPLGDRTVTELVSRTAVPVLDLPPRLRNAPGRPAVRPVTLETAPSRSFTGEHYLAVRRYVFSPGNPYAHSVLRVETGAPADVRLSRIIGTARLNGHRAVLSSAYAELCVSWRTARGRGVGVCSADLSDFSPDRAPLTRRELLAVAASVG